MYGKTYNASLLADGTTATPTSPSTNSGQMPNVIIKNPMAHLESTASLDSGPPPLYHSVYNNFATTWNGPKPTLDSTSAMSGMHQPEDLLLMDVSYYGTTESPSHALLSLSGANPWSGPGTGSGSISVPFHHGHGHQPAPYPNAVPLVPSDMLMSSNATVLMTSPHVSAATPTGAMPYLNGAVSLVESNSSQARFYGQSPASSEVLLFDTNQSSAQPMGNGPGPFTDTVMKVFCCLVCSLNCSQSQSSKSPLKESEKRFSQDTVLSTPV